jgi:hypothetical protein
MVSAAEMLVAKPPERTDFLAAIKATHSTAYHDDSVYQVVFIKEMH